MAKRPGGLDPVEVTRGFEAIASAKSIDDLCRVIDKTPVLRNPVFHAILDANAAAPEQPGLGSNIFLSHAGADNPRVSPIASALEHEGLHVRLDRNELRQGDSFLSFMEQALKTSDYCLLLWSRAASESKWVRAEWEAAFHRTVMESQNFLIVGRIESFPVPELLRPRLRVDLYPEIEPAISELVRMWRNDEKAAAESARPVVAPKVEFEDELGDTTIYLTSHTFAKTFPLKVSMGVPVAAIVQHVRSKLDLPDQLDIKGRVGCRFTYSLAKGNTVLRPELSLQAQSIIPEDLLWLQVEIEPFSATAPVSGKIEKATFRGEQSDLPASARRRYMGVVNRVGLGL